MDQHSAFIAALEADFPLDFFTTSSIEDTHYSSPTPPPFMPQHNDFDFTSLLNGEGTFLEQPFNYTYPSQSLATTTSSSSSSSQSLQVKPAPTQGHSRSTSKSSVYSDVSVPVSLAETVNTAFTTPPPAPMRARSSTPARAPGPLLLPKIRTQDQDVSSTASKRPLKRSASAMTSATPPPPPKKLQQQQKSNKEASTYRPAKHARSFTSPDMMSTMAYAHLSFSGLATPSPSPEEHVPQNTSLLLCTPPAFIAAQESFGMSPPPPYSRRASSCGVDATAMDKYGYAPTYQQMPYLGTPQPEFQPISHQSFTPETTPAPAAVAMTTTLSSSSSATTTLINYLTTPNPATELVQNLTLPQRDPSAKHFWWDVRSLSTWSSFNYQSILALPSVSARLTTPIPKTYLPSSFNFSRKPENEASLHAIYANYYLPKLNAALASSSSRPLKFSVPKQNPTQELLYVANPVDEQASAAAIFGGKQSARIVGLVRGFNGFNSGMRHEGAIQQVKYLRSLAALQYHMREHSTRYGFILTEIELVLVRLGTDNNPTPLFGDMQVTSINLKTADSDDNDESLTACLALWGLTQLASIDDIASVPAGHAHWKAEIGAPADCTRRIAVAKQSWVPKTQLSETREAKRSRGWVWPEDPISKKEVGKRGVKYNGV